MSRPYVLIIDDDRTFAAKLAGALEGLFRVETCHSEEDFHDRFAVNRYDLIIMDMRLDQDREGLLLLKEVFEQDPLQPAIIMTAYADMETYADALESGALTYLDKHEFSPALIARTAEAILRQGELHKRLVALERYLDSTEPLEIIGVSPAIVQVRERVRQAAGDSNRPVLITGESGAGKELVARNIHRLSRRRGDGPFVRVPCSHTPVEETQRLLFGSLTRQENSKAAETKGWIDEAKGGVLFVDEIAFLEANTRDALLRFIATGTFTRIGNGRQIELDMQVIVAATIIPGQQEAVAEFCDTFLKRLPTGCVIPLPALHERRDDIPLLAQYLLQHLYRQGRVQTRSFKGSAIAALESLPWPGNVRELRSAVEYAAIRADAEGAREIGPQHLPMSASETSRQTTLIPGVLDYQRHLARSELALVESTITQFETRKKSDIARLLRYHDRFTFTRRIRRNLSTYPELGHEFPNTVRLFADEKGER